MSSSADQELHGLTGLWWLVVLFGVAVFGVGMFFIVSPHETLSTFTAIIGILLLVDGVVAILASIFGGGGEARGLLALVGALGAIAGLVLVKKPFDTLVVFALIFGVWLVVAGVVRFVAVFAEPERRAANLAIAIVDFIAGIVILAWPGLGLATLAVIIGIALVFRGAVLVAAGWELRRVGRQMDGELRAHPAT